METLGRGCLYLILGFVGIALFVILTGSTIHIPWFILIPLVVLVFGLLRKKAKSKRALRGPPVVADHGRDTWRSIASSIVLSVRCA